MAIWATSVVVLLRLETQTLCSEFCAAWWCDTEGPVGVRYQGREWIGLGCVGAAVIWALENDFSVDMDQAGGATRQSNGR